MTETHFIFYIISVIFDSSTEIWWHCDDDDITEIGDLIEGVYTRESHKQNIEKKESNIWL